MRVIGEVGAVLVCHIRPRRGVRGAEYRECTSLWKPKNGPGDNFTL